MDAATAGLIGAALGFAGGWFKELISGYFAERKARRELLMKTAFEYWQTGFQAAQQRQANTAPFGAFFFHALKIMELAESKDLSPEEFLKRFREIESLHNSMVAEWSRSSGPRIT